MIEPLDADTCHVWWAHRQQWRPALADTLDAAERSRHEALYHEADRQRFVLGCAITRAVLGRHYDMPPEDVSLDRICPDCGRPHGKVRDACGRPPVQMSVSRSGDHVAVAFCPHAAVGVDVERVDRSAEPTTLTHHVLTDAEATAFQHLPPSARAAAFVTYWVRKEALLKTTGIGLRAALTEIVVSAPEQPPQLLRSQVGDLDVGAVQLHDLAPRPGYVAALAVMSPTPTRVRELDAGPLLAEPIAELCTGPGHKS